MQFKSSPVMRAIARVLVFILVLQGSSTGTWTALAVARAADAAPALAAAINVFGPRAFVRATGQPVTETVSFNATAGAGFTLRISNGGWVGQYSLVSSAVIALNGVVVAGPAAFNQQTGVIDIPVTLAASNTLAVELRSKPGSGLTIEIFGEDTGGNQPPVANAGADQTARVGDLVTLNGSSSSDPDGDALTYHWTLISRPAGSAATLANPFTPTPSFTVDAPGAYVARLIVDDGTIDSPPDDVTVSTINSAPVANAGSDQSAAVGQQVTLDGSASSDVDGDPLTYHWSFVSRPAGSAAVLSDPSAVAPAFTVDMAGSYVVQLFVNDGVLNSAPDTVTISTTNSPPVAAAGPDQSAPVGTTITLDGSGSSDVDGNPLTFHWSLTSKPAGSAAALSDPAAVSPTFTIDLPGAYVAQLIVNDGLVNSAPDTVTVTTLNSPPVASAGADQTVTVGSTVTLDGSGSSDVDGNPLAFQWSLTSKPAGSTAALNDPAAVSPSFVVDVPGTYVAQLIVNDGLVNSAPDTVTISTINSAPTANAGADQTALVGATVSLDGSGSADVDGDPLTYLWSLTSRPAGSAATLNNPAAVSPAFVVDVPGAYVAQLIVNDGTVDSAPDTVSISTVNSPPTANAGADQTGFVGGTITLDGSGSTDVDGDALTFQWSFTSRPAGSAATLSAPTAVSPTFVIDEPGAYVVQLIVNDGQADSAPDTVTVSTISSRPVANAGPDQTVTAGTLVTLDGTGSTDADHDPLTYLWSITARPAGSTAALSDATAPQPQFTPDRGGVYVIQLIVNDGNEDSTPDTMTVAARVVVPDVVGDAQAVATQAITGTQLVVGTVAQQYDATVPADHVISQAPVGGTIVDAGTAVDLVISLGPEPVEIPDVTGLTQAEAEAAIIAAGLVVGGVVNESSDTVPPGRVIRLIPDIGGAVPPGTEIIIVVSSGPAVAALTSIQVTPANPSVGRGTPVSFTATGGFSDGHTENITATVEWESTVPAVAAIGADGIASTLGAGSTTIRATRNAITGSTTLTVTAAALASIVVSPGSLLALTGQAQAFSATGVLADGTSQDLAGQVLWSSSAPGIISIDPATGAATTIAPGPAVISAEKDGVTGTATVTVEAIVAEGTAPTASITAPANMALVTAPVNINGTANDANFLKYEIDYAVAGTSSFVPLTAGTVAVVNGLLGQLDPSLLINDFYTLRLRVFDKGGNITTASRTVQVTKDLKVGLFTLIFEDVTVPMSGLPLSIVRVYDSRDKTVGDFGYGWRLDRRSIRIRANRVQGTGWSVTRSGGFLPTYTLVGSEPHRVSVTLPHGKVEEFDLALTPMSQQIVPLQFVTPSYVRRAGTLGTLELLDNSDLLVSGAQPGPVELLDFEEFVPFNPRGFRYTSADGAQVIIDTVDGVQSMRDLNGNTVTFNVNGITHSAGLSIAYTRDAQGRITQITDPNNNVHTYAYDQNGDLASHRDPLGNVTRFFYNLSHGVIEVRDPRGLHPVRNEYDASGRLIATVDASGNRTEYTHNVGASQEVIRDRRGFTTVLSYDTSGNILSRTNALNETTSFSYDARGNELTKTDALGKVWTRTYDASDNVLTELDPLGRAIVRTYNARRQLLTERDRNGNTTTSTYDGNGNQLQSINALSQATVFTYGAGGNRLTSRDALNQTTTFAYDGAGRRTTQTDALGLVTSYTNDANGNRLSDTTMVTVGAGQVARTVRREYDARNRLVADIDAAGFATRFAFNSIGKDSAIVDKNGNRTEMDYNASGQKIRARFADGTIELMGYDAEGNMTSWTDRAGRTTTYEFDPINRPIRTNYPDGTSTSTEYDAAGRTIATTDERGNRTRFEYNDAGHKTAMIDALGNRTAYTVSATGKTLTMTDPNLHVTTYQYDALDRLTRTTFHDGAFTQVSYDAVGRKTADTDQLGRTTQYEYDAIGRLAAVVDPAGGRTEFTYDEAGNRLTQRDAAGSITRWTYDAAGRTASRTLPMGMSESFTYDGHGNVLSRTDFQGRTTTYQYDVNNRLTRTTYPDASTLVFTYTPTGKRQSVTDARGVTTYAYDSRDRLLTLSYPGGAQLTYSYDGKGNVTSLTSPAGTTTNTYDALNRLLTVTDGGGVTAYTYDAAGNRLSVTQPNGLRTVHSYDAMNRLTAIEHRTAADAVIDSFVYTLDARGRRTAVTEASGRSATYTFDARSRLTGETVVDPVNGDRTLTYTYDAVGNRLSKTDNGNTVAYTYDANDRLLTEGAAISYTYDASGNQIRRNMGALTDHYAYDFENRMVRVDGAQVTTYAYDADGARVRATVAGAETSFLVDINRALPEVIEERDAANALVARYTHGDDLIAQSRGGVASYYHFDGTGSTRRLSDAAGATTDTYAYDAFGVALATTGATTNRYRFGGQQFDAETSFYYLRARYLSPSVGRFQTADPASGNEFDPPSLHKYLYANNDPVNNHDASGLFAMAISMPFPAISFPTITLASVLPIIKAVALLVAATCGVSLAVSTFTAMQGPDPCNVKGKANMFYPGADTPITTMHIATAIGSGYPAKLNYISPGHSRAWLRTQPACAGNVAALSGMWCDEYPFASARQGGPGSSVMLAPAIEQMIQGGKLGAFYGLCKITPNVPPDDGYAVGPSLAMPTTIWVCKN